MTEWKRWIDKKAVIETETSKYFCRVVEVTDTGDGMIWIGFYKNSDGKFVLLTTKEIKKIEEMT